MSKKNLLALCLIIFCCGFVYSQEESEIAEKLAKKPDTTKRKIQFNGYPYAFYTPETKFAAGAGGIFVFYTSQDEKISPSKVGFGGYYSSNKQYKISVNPVIYFSEDKIFVQAPVSFGHFIDKFWGVGNSTPETGSEAYVKDVFTFSLTVQVPPVWFSAHRTGLIFEFDRTVMDDKKDNDYLNNDLVAGSNGGNIYGIGTDLVWDTRDNIFFPNKGNYQYFKFVAFPKWGDYVFTFLEMDVRHYTAFAPDKVLAGNIYMAAVQGDVPFYKLPALGGSKRMRGYFMGRYRDKMYALLQMEYRQYFWKRFGYVVFAGLGDVAPSLVKFRLGDLKYSFGAGTTASILVSKKLFDRHRPKSDSSPQERSDHSRLQNEP